MGHTLLMKSKPNIRIQFFVAIDFYRLSLVLPNFSSQHNECWVLSVDHMIAQLVDSQVECGVSINTSFNSIRFGQFMRLSLSTFIGDKVEEDPQDF